MGTLPGHIEPAAIFRGLDEVSHSQLCALLGALSILAAEGIEHVIQSRVSRRISSSLDKAGTLDLIEA